MFSAIIRRWVPRKGDAIGPHSASKAWNCWRTIPAWETLASFRSTSTASTMSALRPTRQRAGSGQTEAPRIMSPRGGKRVGAAAPARDAVRGRRNERALQRREGRVVGCGLQDAPRVHGPLLRHQRHACRKRRRGAATLLSRREKRSPFAGGQRWGDVTKAHQTGTRCTERKTPGTRRTPYEQARSRHSTARPQPRSRSHSRQRHSCGVEKRDESSVRARNSRH